MINKLILIVISMTILNFIVNSCCTEIDKEYVKINGFNTQLIDSNDGSGNSLQSGDTIYTDTLRIQTDIKYEFITAINYKSNAVFALTCKEWGENGLKNKILEINFISNNPFQGLSPNSSLNEFITCNYLHTRNDLSLDSIKNVLNNWKGDFLNSFTFYINAKPLNLSPQKFKIIFRFDNDEYLELETPEIIWI